MEKVNCCITRPSKNKQWSQIKFSNTSTRKEAIKLLLKFLPLWQIYENPKIPKINYKVILLSRLSWISNNFISKFNHI